MGSRRGAGSSHVEGDRETRKERKEEGRRRRRAGGADYFGFSERRRYQRMMCLRPIEGDREKEGEEGGGKEEGARKEWQRTWSAAHDMY